MLPFDENDLLGNLFINSIKEAHVTIDEGDDGWRLGENGTYVISMFDRVCFTSFIVVRFVFVIFRKFKTWFKF